MNMKAQEARWDGQESPQFPFPMLSLDVFLPVGPRVSAPNLSVEFILVYDRGSALLRCSPEVNMPWCWAPLQSIPGLLS